ncbi:TPM domain-containing protein [soil metagenome]
MEFSAQDRRRISAAIEAAEARTSGEVVCVLARGSSDPSALAVLAAALAALALPWFLVAFTALPVQEILWLQLALFAVLGLLLTLPGVRAALLPPPLRRAVAHRAALEQFAVRGIGRTKDRTGVLIFVSLAERYARIIADEAIASRVDPSEWRGAVDALVEHMRGGNIADGFVEAIERCSTVLAAHFPRGDADRNELPDRLYLL